MKTLLDHVRLSRDDVTWIKGPDEGLEYLWDISLPDQGSIVGLLGSFIEGQPLPPDPEDIKVFKYIQNRSLDTKLPPSNVDFVTGLSIKLHRKSTIVRGECTKEEYFVNYDGAVYSDIVVKETTLFNRDALGFPINKTVTVIWYKNSGEEHPQSKTWNKYYSNLEKIQEGKSRRGNLVSNLQMPCIGLISIALTGSPNPTSDVILEGRRFLADYSKEFTVFIEDSNRDIVQCLSDSNHSKYAHQSNYTWIDTMTPYGITIRQFIISELTI